MLTSNVGQKRLTRSVNLSFEQTQKNGNMCKMKVDDCCGFFDPVSHGFPPRQGKAGSSCKAKEARPVQSESFVVSQSSKTNEQHRYFIAPKNKNKNKTKKTASEDGHSRKSQKSKEYSMNSNPFNNTFEMQSPPIEYRKKKSVFSSTMCSKYCPIKLELTECANTFAELLLKSETILNNYKIRCEKLQTNNRKYRKKLTDALRKLKGLETKFT